jgi:hypothetical protein
MAYPKIHSYGSLTLTAFEWSKIIGYSKRTINRYVSGGMTMEEICSRAGVDPFADDENVKTGSLSEHIEASFALSRRKAIRRLYRDLKENIPHYFSPEFKGLKVA